MEVAGLVKNVLLAAGSLLVLALGFLTYSGAVTFSNWPWTKTEIHTSGVLMGFKVGESKLSCFQHVIALENEGEIRALHLVDAEPGTYEERFKGTDLTEADFEAAEPSNIWRLGLAGENAWVLLTFEDDQLTKIERKEYRGPTE